MGKRLQKTVISLLLCAVMLVSNCQAVFATENSALTDRQTAQNEYVSEETAVVQLRQQLKERTDEIVLYFKTTTYAQDSTYYDLFSHAIAHTGAPTEGDYILFHLSGFSATSSAQLIDGLYYVCVSYSVNYYSTKEQEDALNSTFDAVMQQLDLSNKTPYQKISAIYDYITTNISYDYLNKDNPSHFEKLTAYGALINHTCICQGYANLFYRMALSAGIDCRIISGIGNGERHAWNIVCLDGKYYNIDCTWDAERKQSGYDYANFLKSEASFTGHTRDEQYTLDAFCTDYPISETDYTEASYEFVDGDFVFQIGNGQATLTAYTGNSTEVTIPDTADGVPVRFVGNEAFFNNSSIQSVTIPSCVLEIDAGWLDTMSYPYVPHGAFAGCTNLIAVLFTESSQLRRIGDWTFADCVNLKHISLPNAIRRLELSCFSTCSSLESIVLPEGLEFIGQNALSYTALKTLHIPASCTEFNLYNIMQNLEAFSVSHGNQRYSTHEGVLYDSAFQPGYITLVHYPIMKPESTYRIPNFCTSINTESFCTERTPENLKVLYIGNLVHAFSLAVGFDPFSRIWCTVIPDETNQHYTSTDGMLFTKDGKTLVQVARNGAKTITVPNGVEFLNGYLFFQDKALEEVILPGSVAEIGFSVFSGTGLKHITLPSTVTHIGSYAFDNCESLTAVYFLGDVPTIESNAFYITETNAFYPLDNATWVNVDMSNWGGAVTLRPFCNDKQHSYTDDITHPTCTENGFTIHTCSVCGDFYVGNKTSALGHNMGQWTVVKEATPSAKGEEKRTCSRCDHVETRELEYAGNVLVINTMDLLNPESVWIDGVQCVVTRDGDTCYITLPEGKLTNMVSYSYNENAPADIHTQYPTGMQVWQLIQNADGTYSANYVKELDNILQYAGSSIRITGTKGIRMITSIEKSKKTALTGGGLAGYKLVEYGTALCWAKDLKDNKPMVLGQDYVKSNYAYKKGVADPVFAQTKDMVQYTNVLVGFNLNQCEDDIAMRSYIILEDADGTQVTIYGGTVFRSIGYIAYQNRNVFKPGNASYDYVWEIIHHVYGNKYDADFKG